MAKFCGKCGRKLDETTGICPNCDEVKIEDSFAQEKMLDIPKQQVVKVSEELLSKKEAKKTRKADKKATKKAEKKEKWEKLTIGQKVRRLFFKLLMWLLLLGILGGGVIGVLSYLGMLDISLLSVFNQDNLFEVVNEKAIVIEETNIVMETDTRGTATIVVKMPDYEQLFKKASTFENPQQYLFKALVLGQYNIQEFEETAIVTVDNDVTTVHSDEVVHRLLEEALINAINALSEVK